MSHKPGGRLPLLSARPAVTPAALKRAAPISLLGEQRHDGCEQFAQDCYPTASRLRFEPTFEHTSDVKYSNDNDYPVISTLVDCVFVDGWSGNLSFGLFLAVPNL